ncbi:SUKH-4 family immunity protein [Kitasatospora sp. NPDC008115]|uniref:SUKH-4 family immunity protein n=1 Tax=Kitasatospora sp. NPDC008115 TaxID=3364022 RepID=UPI0036E4A937
MSPLVDRSMMESVFDAGELVTLDEAALAVIPHGPTRAFLRDVGLPDEYCRWLELDEALAEGVVTLVGEAGASELAAKYPRLTVDTSTWMTVGGIGYDNVALDVVDGTVYCIPESGAPCILNSGIDVFAHFLHALEVERPNYDFESDADGFTPRAEDRLRTFMEAADPVALAHPDSAWHIVLECVERKLQ